MSYKNKIKPPVIGLKFTRVPTNVSRRPSNISTQKNSSRSSTSSRSTSSRSTSSSRRSNSRKGNKKSQKTKKKPPQKGRGSSSSGK